MTRFNSIVPVTGESVYSILSRIHVFEANVSPLVTLKSWTGVRGYKPLSGLPTHLSVLASEMSLSEGPMKLIQAHTHFPLYAHFLSSDRKQMVIDAMLKAGAPKSRVGLLRNDMGAGDSLRYCPSCEQTDIERYGVALWHREHSFPWLMVCADHNERLREHDTYGAFGDRKLELPGRGVFVQSLENSDAEAKIHYLANQVKILLERRSSTFISTPVYRRLLKEAGYITQNGCVRQKHLQELVADWLEPVKKLPGFERIYEGLKVDRNWISELVAGSERFHHPVKHMVLWGGLGWDAADVLNTASTFGEQLQLPLSSVQPVVLSKDLVDEIVSIAGSLRKAAKIIGVDVSTLIVAVESFGQPIKRRPKKITTDKRIEIASESRSIPARVLAKRYDISVTTVNRIRRALTTKAQEELSGI